MLVLIRSPFFYVSILQAIALATSVADVLSIRPAFSDYNKVSLTTRDIKLFTRYSLFFKAFSRDLAQRLGDDSSGDVCTVSEAQNSTAVALESMINRCPNVKYFPRLLTTKQVSWKKTNKSANKSENQTRNASSQDSNDEVVSEFLAFTLLLPDHPFSSDLYYALTAVAPMFPRVTFVIGSAHEFHELCSQYGVRSFPKLLFFHKGILRGKHSRAHEAGALAAEIAKWTKLLPKSFPIDRKLVTAVATSSSLKSRKPPDERGNFSFSDFLSWLPDIGPSIEPIAVSHEALVKWDRLIFFLSGLYVVGRILYRLLISKS